MKTKVRILMRRRRTTTFVLTSLDFAWCNKILVLALPLSFQRNEVNKNGEEDDIFGLLKRLNPMFPKWVPLFQVIYQHSINEVCSLASQFLFHFNIALNS